MTGDSAEVEVKIADFGLCRVLGPNESRPTDMGTLIYCAPSILLGNPCGKEVDLWALGVIIYVLLTGVYPFYSEDHAIMIERMVCEKPDFSSEVWSNVSNDALDVCRGLLKKKKEKRFDVETILNMQWFKEDESISTAMQSCLLNVVAGIITNAHVRAPIL